MWDRGPPPQPKTYDVYTKSTISLLRNNDYHGYYFFHNSGEKVFVMKKKLEEFPSIALTRICKQILDTIEKKDPEELALCFTDAWLLTKMETNKGKEK